MKQFLSGVLATAFLVQTTYASSAQSVFTQTNSAIAVLSSATGVEAYYDNFKLSIINNKDATITKYTGAEAIVTVPYDLYASQSDTATYNFMDVYTVGIDTDAFKGNQYIKDVTLNNGIQTIGNSAFEGCSNLETIVLPTTITSIGDSAFENCSKLDIDTINADTIGDRAFAYCVSLDTVTINAKSIGNSAFTYCTSLDTVILTEGLTDIGAYAFAGNSSLDEIYLPKSLETLDPSAFDGCTATIYFAGTEDEWEALLNGATLLGNCTVKYETEPPSNDGTTSPDDGTTSPDDGTTSPDGGTTSPDGGTTSPDDGATDPDDVATDPDDGTTDPDGGTTDPDVEDTSPDVEEEDNSTTTPDSDDDSSSGGVIFPNSPNYSYGSVVTWPTPPTVSYTENFFSDVLSTSPFYDEINVVINGSIMVTEGTRFQPYLATTRGAIAHAFYVVAGKPVVWHNGLLDVDSDNLFADGIYWVKSVGLMTGNANNYFLPDDTLTREQFASFLYMYERNLVPVEDNIQYKGANTINDARSINSWSQNAVTWCVKQGLMRLDGDGNFSPHDVLNREDLAVAMATFLTIM